MGIVRIKEMLLKLGSFAGAAAITISIAIIIIEVIIGSTKPNRTELTIENARGQ